MLQNCRIWNPFSTTLFSSDFHGQPPWLCDKRSSAVDWGRTNIGPISLPQGNLFTKGSLWPFRTDRFHVRPVIWLVNMQQKRSNYFVRTRFTFVYSDKQCLQEAALEAVSPQPRSPGTYEHDSGNQLLTIGGSLTPAVPLCANMQRNVFWLHFLHSNPHLQKTWASKTGNYVHVYWGVPLITAIFFWSLLWGEGDI